MQANFQSFRHEAFRPRVEFEKPQFAEVLVYLPGEPVAHIDGLL